ncbi:hypothetical protein NBRC116188_15610 [Oceaniserpentilla sp. 4NH20-0058]
MPTKMIPVRVPSNTNMYVGKANSVDSWGSGGGEQYYTTDWVTPDWLDRESIVNIE